MSDTFCNGHMWTSQVHSDLLSDNSGLPEPAEMTHMTLVQRGTISAYYRTRCEHAQNPALL